MLDWLKILIPPTATILAVCLSARWAIQCAFKARWWERKEKAYSEIVDALYDIIRYSELRAEEELQEYDHRKVEEFSERYSEAYWKIQKATDIGAFVISGDVSEILTKLRNKSPLNWREIPPWELHSAEAAHYREALAQIRECAKRDLQVLP